MIWTVDDELAELADMRYDTQVRIFALEAEVETKKSELAFARARLDALNMKFYALANERKDLRRTRIDSWSTTERALALGEPQNG